LPEPFLRITDYVVEKENIIDDKGNVKTEEKNVPYDVIYGYLC